MRRPSALPPPPGVRGAVAVQDPPGAAAPVNGDDTTTQPIPLPIAPSHPSNDGPDAAAPAPPHADVLPADDSADSDRPLGWRDVWRAARARRRALRAEVRRFTARPRRRRRAWVAAAVSLVALTLATLGAAYSPLFAVEQITVVGTSGLDADAVAAALGGQVGTPLPLVDESAVKAALVRFPLVESYTLEARPPHELVVRIVERTPIGAIASNAGYTVVDAAGVAVATTPDAPGGMPLLTVTGGVDTDAFRSVGQVMRALPQPIRTQVTAVTATTANDVTLTLGATGTRIVWGSADDSALKAVVLETTMRVRPPDTVAVYDVSSPSAVVVG